MHFPDVTLKKRFAWGAVLAWAPFALFFILFLRNALRGISSDKATGLGAVAGGLAEALVIFGFLSLLGMQVAAIVFLIRSFSAKHPMRAIFSVASLFCCCLTLLFLASFIWLAFYRHS